MATAHNHLLRPHDPGEPPESKTQVSWNANRSTGSPSSVGNFCRWLVRWVGAFSSACLIEADSGFPINAAIRWSEFTNHTICERHQPEKWRPLRGITHADRRRDVQICPGLGRFIIASDPDLLTIYVHLPPVTLQSESETAREQNLTAISKVIRKKSPQQKVVIQGDWNIDQLPVMQGAHALSQVAA